MKRTTHAPIRALALLLAVMLMLTAAPLTAFAQTSDEDQAATPAAENVTQATSTQADTTATAMPPATLTAADIPEMLSATVLAQRGTVRRVYEEETDASTLLFENNDGTRTMYLFGAPVKYIAPDGTTRDKSTAIATLSNLQPLWSGTALTPAQTTALAQNASIGRLGLDAAADALTLMSNRLGAAYGNELTLSDIAYATLDSDIRTLYPTIVTDGIVLNYGDYSIRTIPITTGNLTLPGMASVAETDSLTDAETRTRVRYNSVFGTGTVLQYTPTNMGVKEEIILTRNVGKNEFPFLLETGGLNIVEQNGSYVFLDPTTQKVIATLGEVIVYDSNGAITRGEMTVQTIREGLQYGVTLTVSEEFLANAAYPVSVDPTAYIHAASNAVESRSIYSSEAASYYRSTSVHVFGTSTEGGETFVGRVYFRLPTFNQTSTECGALVVQQIGSVKLYLPCVTASSSSLTMTARPGMFNWSTGMQCGDFAYSSFSDSQYTGSSSYSNSGNLNIDITSIAKEWKKHPKGTSTYAYSNPAYGVLVMLDDESQSFTVNASTVFATVEYAYSSYIGDIYLNNRATRTFLGGATGSYTYMRSGSVAYIGNDITWTFEYAGDSWYYIHPNGQSAMYLSHSGSINTVPAAWYITTASGGGLNISTPSGSYLGVTNTGVVTVSSSLSADNMAWRMVQASKYNEIPMLEFVAETISLSETITYDMSDLYNGYTFNNENDFTWNISSGAGIACTNGYVQATENDSYAEITVTHLPTALTTTFAISVRTPYNGFYHISDANNNYSMGTISYGVAYSGLVSQSHINYGKQLWYFEYLGRGQYKIINMGVSSPTYQNDMALTLAADGSLCLQPYGGYSTQVWVIEFYSMLSFLKSSTDQSKYVTFANNELSITEEISRTNIISVSIAPQVGVTLDYNEKSIYRIDIDSSALFNNDAQRNIYNGCTTWNGYGVSIYEQEENPEYTMATMRVITVVGLEDISGAIAQANYLQNKIEISIADLSSITDQSYIERVLAHEMGHILALEHLDENGVYANNSILSLMNYANEETPTMIVTSPSYYDMYAMQYVLE